MGAGYKDPNHSVVYDVGRPEFGHSWQKIQKIHKARGLSESIDHRWKLKSGRDPCKNRTRAAVRFSMWVRLGCHGGCRKIDNKINNNAQAGDFSC
jgi:hypothetical protein